jgi:hypothetical protein
MPAPIDSWRYPAVFEKTKTRTSSSVVSQETPNAIHSANMIVAKATFFKFFIIVRLLKSILDKFTDKWAKNGSESSRVNRFSANAEKYYMNGIFL